MRVLKRLGVFALGVLLTSCTPSLHPLFTDKDVVFEPALLGKWIFEDDEHNKTEWTFTRAGDSAYALVHVEDGDPGRFEARLLRLGQYLFLDIYPEEPALDNGFYKLHLIRAHTFARVTLEDDVLAISMMDQEWLEKAIEGKELSIGHERLNNGGIMLTAATAELQQFVLKVVQNPEAFPEPSNFRRCE